MSQTNPSLTEADLFDSDTRPVARVALNGYNIEAGSVLGRGGALRSYKLVDGSVAQAWSDQSVLLLRAADGQSCRVRIFAIPPDGGSLGFIEFL